MISALPENYTHQRKKGFSFKKIFKRFINWIDYPFLQCYRGFGNENELILQGHVFKGLAIKNPDKREGLFTNAVRLLKTYTHKTVSEATVLLAFNGKEFKVKSSLDGFFEFRIKGHDLPLGWHEVDVRLADKLSEYQEEVRLWAQVQIIPNCCEILVSDIDDTFLVSHSTRFFRKMYLLLTKNPETRKPFEGVADFYRHLQMENKTRPFFFVSSSEWNLYEFIVSFCRFHHLPKGILQLRDIKKSVLAFFTSKSDHFHKQEKIERIISFFPDSKLILLGDNGQQDAYIYSEIMLKYPDAVKAVFIRKVRSGKDHKIL